MFDVMVYCYLCLPAIPTTTCTRYVVRHGKHLQKRGSRGERCIFGREEAVCSDVVAGGGREGPGSQPGPWPATRVPPPVARAAAARPHGGMRQRGRGEGGEKG